MRKSRLLSMNARGKSNRCQRQVRFLNRFDSTSDWTGNGFNSE